MARFAFRRLAPIGHGPNPRVVRSCRSPFVIPIFWLLRSSLKPLGIFNLIILLRRGGRLLRVLPRVPIAFGFSGPLRTYCYLALTTGHAR